MGVAWSPSACPYGTLDPSHETVVDQDSWMPTDTVPADRISTKVGRHKSSVSRSGHPRGHMED